VRQPLSGSVAVDVICWSDLPLQSVFWEAQLLTSLRNIAQIANVEGEACMARIYEWTEDEDDVALDAITVGIQTDSRILTVAGLHFGQRDAVVYWPEWQGKSGSFPAEWRGPCR
jgi:hypothetical protein